jgi:DNA (cytosine-5)-methyltransferase 1
MTINFLDLFSGAGGFTLGLQNAGLNPIGAIESDVFASETYRKNFPSHQLISSDIKRLTKGAIKNNFSGVDLIVGGPPCQGFSVAGPSQYGLIDPRNYLIFEVLRFVEILRPRMFIVENVKGILAGKLSLEKRAFQEFISAVQKANYKVKYFVLQAANFGAPQWRERVFIFGALDEADLPLSIEPRYGTPEIPWTSVGEAISDLPFVDAGSGTEDLVRYGVSAQNKFQRRLRKGSKGVVNHVSMKHTPRLIERFKHIPIGGSLVDVPTEHGQRHRKDHKLDVKSRFKMNNQRLDPDKVSTAITASFQSNFIHPVLNRNLTAREGARIQTFPDSFKFYGPRTLMSKTLLVKEGRHDEIGLSQYNQIGNAVAPMVAQVVGEEILKCFLE